jgi:hypothetical protein
MKFLPEADRDYLLDKSWHFREVLDGTHKGIVLVDFPLPSGKYNYEKVDILIIFPSGYPDSAPDMFYVFPPLLLMPINRPARAADATFQFEGRSWQRWSRHFDRQEWRAGIDSLRSYLKKVENALQIAG